MSRRESAPLACLDANIFLAVLIPEATRAPKNEIAGAARVLKSVEEGNLQGVTTAILFGEIRYAYLREDKLGFEIARAAIEAEANLRVVAVTASLAVHAAELRRKYYSKKSVFSYNDGLYLATAVAEKVDLIVTTDPHLLNVRELKTVSPSQYR
jgi:predicted nucleic acid-binding protein